MLSSDWGLALALALVRGWAGAEKPLGQFQKLFSVDNLSARLGLTYGFCSVIANMTGFHSLNKVVMKLSRNSSCFGEVLPKSGDYR